MSNQTEEGHEPSWELEHMTEGEAEGAGENRSVRGDLAAAFNCLKGVIEERAPYFSQRCMEVRHNHCKLQQGFDTEEKSLHNESG